MDLGLTDVATSVAVAGALLLLAAGVGHVRHSAELRAALAAQRLVARRWQPAVAAALGPAEVVAGLGALFAWLSGAGAVVRIAFAGLTAVYLAFTAYLLVLLRARPGAPCGCLGGGESANAVTLARAALVAVTAGCAAATEPPDDPALRWGVVAASAIVAGILAIAPTLPVRGQH